MHTKLDPKNNKPFKPSLLYKNAFIYSGGGIASVLSARFADPLIGKLPSIFGNGSLFWKSAYSQVISDNIKEKLRKEMHVKEHPEDAWKMGIVAGVTIGLVKPVVSTFWSNVTKYHKEKTQSEPTTFGPYSSIFEMAAEKGFFSFFDGYLSNVFSDFCYGIPYNGIKEYNNYWMKKEWLPKDHTVFNEFWVSFAIGSISATQAVLVGKPLEMSLRSMFGGKKTTPGEIYKKSIDDIKKKGPKTGIKVFLWSNMKRQMPTLEKLIHKKLRALN
ncbi:hypothetical protein M0812_27823 [Anaeramoeba flamelloides]|uniref:Mitochondrial carrier protein n=1 Tax=Anaeramoeba flamelloides TaxID=1746091 RepID=A0AAV7Y9V0_9EUKA|nr:hypothetical protein M0812_27823 [Anaeramoeba flamelloides]